MCGGSSGIKIQATCFLKRRDNNDETRQGGDRRCSDGRTGCLVDRGDSGRIELVNAPCEALPHPDNTFDGVTIAFIVTDLEKAVSLMKEKGVRLGHVTKDGILDMKRSRVAYFNPQDTGGVLLEFVEPIED